MELFKRIINLIKIHCFERILSYFLFLIIFVCILSWLLQTNSSLLQKIPSMLQMNSSMIYNYGIIMVGLSKSMLCDYVSPLSLLSLLPTLQGLIFNSIQKINCSLKSLNLAHSHLLNECSSPPSGQSFSLN